MQFANTLKTNGYSNTKFYTSASWIGTNTETCQMNYNTLGGPKNLWAAQYLYGKPSSNDLKNQQYGAWQYTSQMYYQGTSNLKKNAVDTSIDYSNYFTSTSPVPPSTYTITFNTDGGTPIANQSVAAGSVVSQPAAPTKAGFNFSGWYSDSSLTQAYNFAKVITSNTTLYAKWIPITSPSISYQAQVQNIGWQKNSYNGETAGTTGLGLRMESLKISLINLSNGLTNSNSHIQYQGYVQNIGWQNPVQDGTIAGTVGQGLRFEAIKMNLSGEIANQYDLYYRVQAQNIGWMDWAKNGEAAGTSTMSYRLEAIQIQLVKKGNPAPGATTFTFLTTPSLQYCTQVQNIGWQNPVSTGQISGTVGKSLRTEALKINIGWQAPVSNGQISGTVGQSLRLEALKINLTGRISQYFDINYASQVQNIGWQAPVSNGQISGTVGMSLRVEAVKLSLSPK
ncbi:MAG: InlB B-repeat-containing protein [Lactococcus cremoris]